MRERRSREAPGKHPRSDRETLEKIAARVWGSEGPRVLRRRGGVDALLAEIAQRIPCALDKRPTIVKAIRRTVEQGRETRFRAFVTVAGEHLPAPVTVELGVHVEGRNVRFTPLGAKGAPNVIRATEAASLAWEGIVDELRAFRPIQGTDTQIDGAGRFVHWARFAEE